MAGFKNEEKLKKSLLNISVVEQRCGEEEKV